MIPPHLVFSLGLSFGRRRTMVKPLRVDGADISHHQARVDLRAAKNAGLKFLYHKATEGNGYTDEDYNARRLAARAVSLPFGAYHFARPERGDARGEAERFLKISKPAPGDLIPALDLETDEGLTKDQLKKWAYEFAKVVKDQIGVLPVFYSPWSEWAPIEQVRWVPRYNNTNTPPTVPYDIWQFSNGVYGNPNDFSGLGHVDLNHFNKGMSMRRLILPRQTSSADVKIWHISMQFSDSA